MSKGLQNRLIKGFAAQGFGQVVNLIVQVVSVPLYLHYWGKIHYGEWVLLSSILGYLAISDLSFGNAAQNEMAVRVARDDRQGALTVFQSTWLLISLVSLGIMVISLVAVSVLPLETWLKLTRMPHQMVVTILCLLVLQVILAQQGGLLAAGFRCDGNYALGLMWGNGLRLTEFIVGCLAVACKGGFYGLALSVLLTRLIGFIALYLVLRRCSPWLYIGGQHAQLAVLKPLVGPALSFNAFPLGYALSLQGVLTVVGIYMGPATVTVFDTTRRMTRVIWQMLLVIGNTVWVELSTAFGANDLPLARSLHRRACQVALWGALLAALILTIAGGPIYRIWTHGKVPFDPGLFRLLLLVIFCSSLWSTSYVVPMSINRHQGMAVVFLLATSVSLALSILLVRIWGVDGAAISLLAAEIFMIVYVVRRSLSLLEDDFQSYLRVVLTPPVVWLWNRFTGKRAKQPDAVPVER